jgi:hypothetical protein
MQNPEAILAFTYASSNNRLAKNISLDEYASTRRQTTEAAAECKRRGSILVSEITRRVAR